jgi:hypothetical protein
VAAFRGRLAFVTAERVGAGPDWFGALRAGAVGPRGGVLPGLVVPGLM